MMSGRREGSSGISEKALMVGRTMALSGRMWDRFAEAHRDMGPVGEKLWRQVTGRPGRRGIPTAKLITRILRLARVHGGGAPRAEAHAGGDGSASS